MSRYIDAESLEHRSPKLRALILEQPTADVEPVRHSMWRVASTDPDKEYECMRCKKAVGWKYLYCPNCGAKMDEEEHKNG